MGKPCRRTTIPDQKHRKRPNQLLPTLLHHKLHYPVHWTGSDLPAALPKSEDLDTDNGLH